jgi:uncharacterized FlaG/YvyC family protein
VAGYAIAQRDCSGNTHQLQPQLQQKQDSNADQSSPRTELSPEQRKEVLEELASLLASALQNNQKHLAKELHTKSSDATITSSNSDGSCSNDGASTDDAGLRHRLNTLDKGSAR